jgi:hypothetical protein
MLHLKLLLTLTNPDGDLMERLVRLCIKLCTEKGRLGQAAFFGHKM